MVLSTLIFANTSFSMYCIVDLHGRNDESNVTDGDQLRKKRAKLKQTNLAFQVKK